MVAAVMTLQQTSPSCLPRPFYPSSLPAPWGKVDDDAQVAYIQELQEFDGMSTAASSEAEDIGVVGGDVSRQTTADSSASPAVTLIDLLKAKQDPGRALVAEAVERQGRAKGRCPRDVLQECCARGCTPLLLAVRRGHAEAVACLLELGADAEAKEPASGWTALMYAASLGHAEIVSALLADGASVNSFAPAPCDENALSAGMSSNRESIVGMLLDAGGDLDLLKSRHPGQAATYAALADSVYKQREEAKQNAEMLKPAMWIRNYDQYV